jgi:hypothetical protein
LPDRVKSIEGLVLPEEVSVFEKMFSVDLLKECDDGKIKYRRRFTEEHKENYFTSKGETESTTTESTTFAYVCIDSKGMIYEVGKTNVGYDADLFVIDTIETSRKKNSRKLAWWYCLSNMPDKNKLKGKMTDGISGKYVESLNDKWDTLNEDEKKNIVNGTNSIITDAIIIPVFVKEGKNVDRVAEDVEERVGELLIELGFPIYNFYSHRNSSEAPYKFYLGGNEWK